MILLTTPRKTFDDFSENVRLQFSGAEIIEKKQRLRAQHGDVIDAMIYQVLADGIVPIHGESDFQLRPDPIDARNQHRLFVTARIQREQSAKPPYLAQHLAPMRGSKQLRQRGLDLVSKINIHTSSGIR